MRKHRLQKNDIESLVLKREAVVTSIVRSRRVVAFALQISENESSRFRCNILLAPRINLGSTSIPTYEPGPSLLPPSRWSGIRPQPHPISRMWLSFDKPVRSFRYAMNSPAELQRILKAPPRAASDVEERATFQWRGDLLNRVVPVQAVNVDQETSRSGRSHSRLRFVPVSKANNFISSLLAGAVSC